jgi:predicted Na+-dependent transporter
MNGIERWNLGLNRQVEKYMTFLTPLALVLGFVFSDFFRDGLVLVPWLFAFVMFVMSLSCDFQQIRAVLRAPGVILYMFVAAHLILPLLAWHGGSLLFGGPTPFVIGLFLFAIIPLGVSSILWVGLSKGQVPLVLGLVIIDSLLSPIVVPTAITLLVDKQVNIALWDMMKDLIFILVMPTILGVVWQSLSKGKANVQIGQRLAPWSKLSFVAVLIINAASIRPYMAVLQGNLLVLVIASLSLIIIGYVAGSIPTWLSSKHAWNHTLPYALGMRNISLGLVIALHYFDPLVAVPIVLTILLQQPVASIYYAIYKSRTVKGIT